MNRDDVIQFLGNNKNLFRTEFHVSKIGLFGSFARDNANEDSDIDLIIEFDGNVNIDIYETKEKIKDKIRNELNRNTDICREKYLKNIVKNKILSEVIYV